MEWTRFERCVKTFYAITIFYSSISFISCLCSDARNGVFISIRFCPTVTESVQAEGGLNPHRGGQLGVFMGFSLYLDMDKHVVKLLCWHKYQFDFKVWMKLRFHLNLKPLKTSRHFTHHYPKHWDGDPLHFDHILDAYVLVKDGWHIGTNIKCVTCSAERF